MLKIGITGGIGSGKSTVSAAFVFLGIPFYSSDQRAKWLMNNKPELKQKIQHLFGNQAYIEGELNRKWIAQKAFTNPSLLKELNDAVHPAVEKDYEEFCSQHKHAPYTLKEAAILFESGSYKGLDKIILVVSPLELRIQRVMERDSLSREEVLKRIENQLSDEEKISKSDYVIQNDGEHSILLQVLHIHKKLLGIHSL
jgi:dephospho-CoA kinase